MARIKRSGQGGPKRSGRRGRKKTEVGRGYVVLMGAAPVVGRSSAAARPPVAGCLVLLCRRLIITVWYVR